MAATRYNVKLLIDELEAFKKADESVTTAKRFLPHLVKKREEFRKEILSDLKKRLTLLSELPIVAKILTEVEADEAVFISNINQHLNDLSEILDPEAIEKKSMSIQTGKQSSLLVRSSSIIFSEQSVDQKVEGSPTPAVPAVSRSKSIPFLGKKQVDKQKTDKLVTSASDPSLPSLNQIRDKQKKPPSSRNPKSPHYKCFIRSFESPKTQIEDQEQQPIVGKEYSFRS